MDVRTYMKHHQLVFDGGMGTMLQKSGMAIGETPDLLNMKNPQLVIDIHRAYVQAGCDVITTNTFSCNRQKITDHSVQLVIKNAVQNARAANPKFVALDIGPIGQLLAPMGTLTFGQAYDLFKEQVLAGQEAGADMILLETFSDLMELKIAILAAKENGDLPVFATMTYQEDGRTFVGTDPVSATITLNGLGLDAQGINCSLGPQELMPVVETVLAYSRIPVMVQPNAGLPDINGNYHFQPEAFAGLMKQMAEKGVRVVGGCCGTNPEHIQALSQAMQSVTPKRVQPKQITAVCSSSKTVVLDDGVTVIGERINPTGKPKLKEALRQQNDDYLLKEAIAQASAGADILDVNVGLPELDEPAVLQKAVMNIQSCVSLPLQIDSSDVAAIRSGVRHYAGKPLINSVNGKQESMEALFPIVKTYGACILGLCLDEKGIPKTAEGRFLIAKRIVETAASYGIPKEDVLIDCLVLTASAQQEQVMATLDAIKLVKQRLGVKCVLGVSNVSFGLPDRLLLNSVFLSAAFGAGLDAPILNPMAEPSMNAVHAFRVLNNQDPGAARYISRFSQNAPKQEQIPEAEKTLKDIILEGRKEEAAAMVKALLKTKRPMEIIEQEFIPALDIVGDRYEKQQIFLPQLMLSAEAVKAGFNLLASGQQEKPVLKEKILLATVSGDIHDIGKNIVKMLLSNYGYDVIDLGKDVPIEEVVRVAKEQHIRLVGLSALMTTTVKNMELTIKALREAGLDCKVVVGGAVLTPEYAQMVGADYYAKDARETVRLANQLFSHE